MPASFRSWALVWGTLLLAAALLWAPPLLKRLFHAPEAPEIPPQLLFLEVDPPRVEMRPGEIRFLHPAGTPPEALGEVDWRSSDTSVATVSRGRVRALRPGRVRIEAVTGGFPGIAGFSEVLVSDPEPPSSPEHYGQ